MQFPINSRVKLSMWTGDDQIDYYHDQTLIVTDYREILADWNMPRIPNYTLIAPDGVVITANEYELEAL